MDVLRQLDGRLGHADGLPSCCSTVLLCLLTQ
jgi:hypothetical protein